MHVCIHGLYVLAKAAWFDCKQCVRGFTWRQITAPTTVVPPQVGMICTASWRKNWWCLLSFCVNSSIKPGYSALLCTFFTTAPVLIAERSSRRQKKKSACLLPRASSHQIIMRHFSLAACTTPDRPNPSLLLHQTLHTAVGHSEQTPQQGKGGAAFIWEKSPPTHDTTPHYTNA